MPALIRQRMAPHAESRAAFADHGRLEYVIALTLCGLVAAIGLPFAIRGSILGVVVGGGGLLAMAALLVYSVVAGWGSYAGFDDFRLAIFFLFPLLGLTLGWFYGSVAHAHALSMVYAAAGLAAGYPIGIGAGLVVQRLGWLAGMLDGLALIALPGLLVVDVVLLYL